MRARSLETEATTGSGAWATAAGYVLFLMWFEGSKSFDVAGVSVDPLAAFSLVTMVVDLVALIAIGCLHHRIVSLAKRRGLAVATAAGILVSTIAMAVLRAKIAMPVTLGATFGIIAGVVRAVLAIAWMEVFSARGMRSACLLFAGSTTIGTIAAGILHTLLANWVGDILGGVTGMASVLFMALSLHRPPSAPPVTSGREADTCDTFAIGQDTNQEDTDGRWSFPVKPTILMAVFAATTLLVTNTAGPLQRVDAPVGTPNVVVSLFLLIAVWKWFERFDIRIFGLAAVPFACIGLLGALSPFSELPIPAVFAASLGYYCFSTFMSVLLFNISYRFGIDPLWLFSFARAPRVAAAIVIPSIFGSGIAPLGTLGTDLALAAMIFALVCASYLLVTGKSFDTTWGIRQIGPNEAARQGSVELSLEERCSKVAYLHGLTKREEEVLVLLAQTMSTPEIERALLISNGTARNHIQHVYKKLNVHSREEVASLVSSID